MSENMTATATKEIPGPKTAPELVAETLESVPTMFGRIVWLANMLDRQSGRYEHPLPFRILRDAAISDLLRRTHEQLIISWLDTTAKYRVLDLAQFLQRYQEECFEIASNLLRRNSYADLLPLRIPPMNRDHFLLDMEWALPLAVAQIGEATALARDLDKCRAAEVPAPVDPQGGFAWIRQQARHHRETLASMVALIIDGRIAELRQESVG